MADRLVGTVWRICDKPNQGFCFIRHLPTGQDYFAHNTEIDLPFTQIKVGDEMEFLPVETPKGWRANEVIRVKEFRR